jgi:hypothetical protein
MAWTTHSKRKICSGGYDAGTNDERCREERKICINADESTPLLFEVIESTL